MFGLHFRYSVNRNLMSNRYAYTIHLSLIIYGARIVVAIFVLMSCCS